MAHSQRVLCCYLSDTLVAGGSNWQTFTLTPNNLILNQGQEYVLFLSPNAFVTTSAAYNTFVGAVGSGAYTDGQYCDVAGYHLGINDLFALSWERGPNQYGLFDQLPTGTRTVPAGFSLPWQPRLVFAPSGPANEI